MMIHGHQIKPNMALDFGYEWCPILQFGEIHSISIYCTNWAVQTFLIDVKLHQDDKKIMANNGNKRGISTITALPLKK